MHTADTADSVEIGVVILTAQDIIPVVDLFRHGVIAVTIIAEQVGDFRGAGDGRVEQAQTPFHAWGERCLDLTQGCAHAVVDADKIESALSAMVCHIFPRE